MANPNDPFADAKANIRETVKWLAATFATLAALIIGGSPISGLGELSVRSLPFWISTLCLLISFTLICVALCVTIKVLRPEAIFRSDLYSDYRSDLCRSDKAELERVRKVIDGNAKDLLPYNFPTLKDLGDELDRQAGVLAQPAPPPPNLARARAMVASLHGEFEHLLIFSQYLRLQMRLQDALPKLILLGIGALVSLTTFGVMVRSSPKTPEEPASIIIVESTPIGREKCR